MRDRPSLKPSHCSLRAVALVGEAGNLPRQAIPHSAHVGFSAVRIDLQHAIATLPQPATALVARALSRLVFGLGRERVLYAPGSAPSRFHATSGCPAAWAACAPRCCAD